MEGRRLSRAAIWAGSIGSIANVRALMSKDQEPPSLILFDCAHPSMRAPHSAHCSRQELGSLTGHSSSPPSLSSFWTATECLATSISRCPESRRVGACDEYSRKNSQNHREVYHREAQRNTGHDRRTDRRQVGHDNDELWRAMNLWPSLRSCSAYKVPSMLHPNTVRSPVFT